MFVDEFIFGVSETNLKMQTEHNNYSAQKSHLIGLQAKKYHKKTKYAFKADSSTVVRLKFCWPTSIWIHSSFDTILSCLAGSLSLRMKQ